MQANAHVYTALDTKLCATLEAIFGAGVVVEIFIIPSESEPSGGVGTPCSLEILERCTWAMTDVFRIRP
jgi:hypothetical protein